MHTLGCSNRGRIPSLDGLRGISILAVTAYHIIPAGPRWPQRIIESGHLGVDVFFVVSGFLITHLLLREQERTGRISLMAFYGRRVLRLSPAYYFYLAVVFGLTVASLVETIDGVDWLAAITYTVNFIPPPRSRWFVHLWSLAVEEQFYLLWPGVLAVIGARRAAYAVVASFAVAPALRFAMWGNLVIPDLDSFILARVDTLGMGCLMAYAVRMPTGERISQIANRWPTIIVIASIATLVISDQILSQSGKYDLGPKRAIEAMAIAAIVFTCVLNPQSLPGRICAIPLLAWIGVLSYSLYLAQGFISPPSPWPFSLPINIGICIGYALLSHYCVERPFLAIKDRLGKERHG